MIKGMLILLGLATITAFAVNHLSPRGIALIGSWNTAEGVVSAKSKDDAVLHEREIGDIRAVKRIFDQGGTLFIDARSAGRFAEGHISGAISLPTGEADGLIDSLRDTIGPDTPIVTYCSGRECEDGHLLAELLTDLGYSRVRVFVDGFPAWKKEGYPIE